MYISNVLQTRPDICIHICFCHGINVKFPVKFAVPHRGVAHEGPWEEAPDPAGEAGGGAREGAPRQPEEAALARARVGRVPKPGRRRLGVSSHSLSCLPQLCFYI